MNKEEFIKELQKINIKLNEEQLSKLSQYYQMLLEENEHTNLTRITNEEDVYLKHFYDSLTINKIIDLKKVKKLCDIGSGAGFPGIVLKIAFPNINITLVDSLDKRIKFLNKVIEKLNLTNIKAIHTRAEEYARLNEEGFDIITSRAVAKTNILLELSSKMLKKDGYLILLKSSVEEELQASANAFKILHMELTHKEEFYLPKEDSLRTILKIKKVGTTPKMYPRDFSQIKKRPL